jgi:hypothetical protein
MGCTVLPAFADHERFGVASMGDADPSGDTITSVSGACVPTHDREKLDCYFTSFSLYKERSDEERKKELDEFVEGLNRDPARHIAALKKGFCNQKMLNPDPVRLKYSVWLRTFYPSMKTFCENPSRDSALNFFKTMTEAGAGKCRCWVSDWRASFIRQVDRWVSNSGPAGLCGVVRVGTLTPQDPKKMKETVGPTLWRFDQRSIVTRADSQACKFFKVKDAAISLSWDAPTKSLDCNEFEFGSLLDGMSDPTRKYETH